MARTRKAESNEVAERLKQFHEQEATHQRARTQFRPKYSNPTSYKQAPPIYHSQNEPEDESKLRSLLSRAMIELEDLETPTAKKLRMEIRQTLRD